MKEYGFEEIEKEVKKMCNLGEMIAAKKSWNVSGAMMNLWMIIR